MTLDGTLQHWFNGEPTSPDEGLLEQKYWLNGEPYIMIEPSIGSIGSIINQFQKTNIGSDLYNGVLSI